MNDTIKFETFREKFAYYDRTGMQEFFEQKALEGLQLCKREVLSDWVFKRIEPKKLHYAITYLPQFSNEDSFLLSENKNEYLELCAEQGWQYVCVYKNMVIFLSEEENPVPLETDPEIELDTIHKSMKRHSIPRIVLSFAGMAVLFAIMLLDYFNNPINFFLGVGSRIYLLMLFFAMFVLYNMAEFFGYLRWRKKALAAAAMGEFTKTDFSTALFSICFAVVCVLSVLMILVQAVISKDKTVFGFFAVGIAYIIVGHFLDNLKEKYNNGWKKRVVSIVSVLVFVAAIACGYFAEARLNSDKEPAEKYISTHGGYEFYAYKDDIPLTLEDLGLSVNSEQYSYYLDIEKSAFITRTQATQTVRLDVENYSSMPELEYNIYEIKLQFLYDRCLYALLDDAVEKNHSGEDVQYKETEPSVWSANKAYKLSGKDISDSKYLLCYDNKIVEITAEFALDEELAKIIGEKFGE